MYKPNERGLKKRRMAGWLPAPARTARCPRPGSATRAATSSSNCTCAMRRCATCRCASPCLLSSHSKTGGLSREQRVQREESCDQELLSPDDFKSYPLPRNVRDDDTAILQTPQSGGEPISLFFRGSQTKALHDDEAASATLRTSTAGGEFSSMRVSSLELTCPEDPPEPGHYFDLKLDSPVLGEEYVKPEQEAYGVPTRSHGSENYSTSANLLTSESSRRSSTSSLQSQEDDVGGIEFCMSNLQEDDVGGLEVSYNYTTTATKQNHSWSPLDRYHY
eukprot:g26432.t1